MAPKNAPGAIRKKINAALTDATSLTFDDFAGQVLPYLPDAEQHAYDARNWDDVVLRVVDALERLA